MPYHMYENPSFRRHSKGCLDNYDYLYDNYNNNNDINNNYNIESTSNDLCKEYYITDISCNRNVNNPTIYLQSQRRAIDRPTGGAYDLNYINFDYGTFSDQENNPANSQNFMQPNDQQFNPQYNPQYNQQQYHQQQNSKKPAGILNLLNPMKIFLRS